MLQQTADWNLITFISYCLSVEGMHTWNFNIPAKITCKYLCLTVFALVYSGKFTQTLMALFLKENPRNHPEKSLQ